MAKQESLHFISSHGELYIFPDGSIDHEKTIFYDEDDPDWLGTIKKVDFEELANYYKLNKDEESFDCGDVLDFGYWTKDDNYVAPPLRWRLETFHNQKFQNYQIIDAIRKSIEWIESNRGIKIDHKKLLSHT